MKILLINPLCRLPFMLPLGLGYIASVARNEGHSVNLLDINGFGYSEGRVEAALKSSEFDIVGIGGLTSTYRYVKWLARTIRQMKPGVKIVAGNMVATAHPELLLARSDVDIAVIDEGETTFRELCAAIERGTDLKAVDGIFFKENGAIVKTGPRSRITDLDSLPFPAWDLFPMETYLNNSTQSAATFGLRSINISSVRGCPYDCVFCSRPFGTKAYARSAKSIVGEMKELRERYRVDFIDFSDDLFMLNEKRIGEFCDLLVAEGLDLRWGASGRVNLVNDRILSKMHKAGCAELSYGFESGSQEMLDRMGKRATVAQAEEAVAATRKAGIRVTGSFIFGMPGETGDTIKETLGFIKRTRLPLYRFFYATPYPGTKLYEIAREMGRLPADEDRYLENLGEMRTTFLVNLTDFPDEELVRLKNGSEAIARKNLPLSVKLELFTEDWQRRYIIVRRSIKDSGLIATLKKIYSKVLLKVKR
ncbi:MAG: radical SAM protein [Candidatus Omnitrophota bacterium]